MKRLVQPLTLLAFSCVYFTGSAIASPIGTLNVTNCAGGGITVTTTDIIWSPTGTSPGTGCIVTGLGTNVSFSGGTIAAAEVGNIKNLSAGGGAVNEFMTFPSLGPIDLNFVLTNFGAGSSNTNCASANTPGATCSVVAGSPFILTFLGNIGGIPNTTISLSAFGTVSDANGISNWSGGFSNNRNLTPGTIQALVLAQGFGESTYAGQFKIEMAGVPEPMTALLIGAGLVLLALFRPRYQRP